MKIRTGGGGIDHNGNWYELPEQWLEVPDDCLEQIRAAMSAAPTPEIMVIGRDMHDMLMLAVCDVEGRA